MSETLFTVAEDQAVTAEIEKLKTQFTKEDGTVDMDALLKSKAHSNLHIAKVESEAGNLRKELDTRLTYQDLLDKINTQRTTTSSEEDDSSHVNEQNPKAITEDVLDQKLNEGLLKLQQEATKAANEQYVVAELVKSWGPNYAERLRQVTKDLHQTEKDMVQMARTNPKGFLAIVLPKAQETNSFAPPATRTNTTAMKGSQERNWNYYKKLMKEDRKRFDSVETQTQMHDDAAAMGASFYN